jgi:hypothetical protein
MSERVSITLKSTDHREAAIAGYRAGFRAGRAAIVPVLEQLPVIMKALDDSRVALVEARVAKSGSAPLVTMLVQEAPPWLESALRQIAATLTVLAERPEPTIYVAAPNVTVEVPPRVPMDMKVIRNGLGQVERVEERPASVDE